MDDLNQPYGYGYSQGTNRQQPYEYPTQGSYYPPPVGGPSRNAYYEQSAVAPPIFAPPNLQGQIYPDGPPAMASYPQQPQQDQAYATPAGSMEKGQPTSEKAVELTKKFKDLMGRARRDSHSSSSSSSSSCSSSSSSDSDSNKTKMKTKKKEKKKKKKAAKWKKPTPPQFATTPHIDPSHGPHPFSVFTSPAGDAGQGIVLAIADMGEGEDVLVGPRHDADHPAYRIIYADDGRGFKAHRFRLPGLTGAPVAVGTVESRDGRCFFDLPWARWDLSPDDEWWQSNVGTGGGGKNWMRWCLIRSRESGSRHGDRFTARCVDTTQRGMPTVASFEMNDFDHGSLEIAVAVPRTLEQLDELVIVSFAVMDHYREVLRRS